MAALKLAATAVVLLWTGPAAAQVRRWAAEIGEASVRFAIPAPWIRRVMAAESNGQTVVGGRPITSRAGAMGLMQLMPATWADMRLACRLGDDPFNPRDNIIAGAAYLRAMYERFGYPGMFAAYNAGPGRYSDHLATGRPLPRETVEYLRKTASGTLSIPEPARLNRAQKSVARRRTKTFASKLDSIVAFSNGPPKARPATRSGTADLFALGASLDRVAYESTPEGNQP